MKNYILLLVLLLALGSAGCGKKEKSSDSLPAPTSSTQQAETQTQMAFTDRNLAELMKFHSKGVVSPQPWVGYWWPYVGAGIASTWRDFNGMSPADKYDRAYVEYLKAHGVDVSNYKSMASWERGRHGPGLANVASWWGHCNGWAASSIMVAEPTSAKTVNGVTFAIRDQKALLAESWMEFSGDFIGNRVNDPGDFSSAAFWDIVPAQFHLLLANLVGKHGRGLILDRHTGHEIWNQPLVAYRFEPIKTEDYLGAHPSYPDIYRVNLTAKIWWANDNVGPDEVTPKFEMEAMEDKYFDHSFPGRKLRYELWLDAPIEFDSQGNMVKSGDILVTEEQGKYVGGIWKNGLDIGYLINTHPDYMWVPFGVQQSTGYKNPRIDDGWVRANIGSTRN